MDFTPTVKAIIIGIIEGLTEFIPVSSTAHLLLASEFLNFSQIDSGIFEVTIQLGAILAVLLFYFKKIFSLVVGYHKDQKSRIFVNNLILAFIPSAIFGAILYDIIKQVFFSLNYIAYSLIIGGILIIIIEKSNIKAKYFQIDKINKKTALYIGFFQILAIIPGVSRSGATIMGSLLLKLDRKTATEFSFFLAIPTIFGATFFDLYQNYDILLNNDNYKIIFIGFISAFFSSLLVIKWLINYVSYNNFIMFAIYRIVIGFLIIIYIF